MAGNNNTGGNNKNPWNRGSGGGGRPGNPWGVPPPGGGDIPPDLEDMIRKAQKNLYEVFPGGFRGGGIALMFLIATIMLWLTSGFYIIQPGMHGVIQRFGAWDRTQSEEGLGYHLPWPVEQITKVNVSNVREMKIGFADVAARGVSQKRDLPEESLMLTSDYNIVDLDLVVQWDIKSAEDFLFNINDQENTVKKVAESAIREVVGQTDMFQIITTEREQVADKAEEIMRANLDDYKSGVNIKNVLIQAAEVHPDVQDAFQDVQSAKQDAENVQNQAEAYREDILPRARGEAIKLRQEAEGYRQSIIAKAQGDAERFNSVYQAYLTGQDVTKRRIYIETMEEVFKNAQKVILDEGAGQKGSGVVPYLPLDALKRTDRQQ
jgi:membrane protease subunit HflK